MYEGRIETEMDSRGGKMKLTSFSPNGELGQGIESSDVDDGELNQLVSIIGCNNSDI